MQRVERSSERRNARFHFGPRQHAADHDDGADVKNQNAANDRGGHARDGARRFFRFRCCNGDHFSAHHREDDCGDGSKYCESTLRRKTTVRVKVREGHALGRMETESVRQAQRDEGDDGRNLDGGKPKFEFTVGARRHQVDAGHERHQP